MYLIVPFLLYTEQENSIKSLYLGCPFWCLSFFQIVDVGQSKININFLKLGYVSLVVPYVNLKIEFYLIFPILWQLNFDVIVDLGGILVFSQWNFLNIRRNYVTRKIKGTSWGVVCNKILHWELALNGLTSLLSHNSRQALRTKFCVILHLEPSLSSSLWRNFP